MALGPWLLAGYVGFQVVLSLTFLTVGAFLSGRRPGNAGRLAAARLGHGDGVQRLHQRLRRTRAGPRPRLAARPRVGGLGGGGGLASRLRAAGLPAAAVPPRPPAVAALAAVRLVHGGRLPDAVAERRRRPRRRRALLPGGRPAGAPAGRPRRRRRVRRAARPPSCSCSSSPWCRWCAPAPGPRGGAPAGQVVRLHGGHGDPGVRRRHPGLRRRGPVPPVRPDPGLGGGGRVQVPAVRHRPADQPDPGLRAAHGPADRRLRRPGVPARAAARPGHRRLGPGRGRLHPGRGGAVPAGPPAGPGAGRPPLQPRAATTPPRRWSGSAAASATRSTSTPCRPSCWPLSTTPSSRPGRRSGCGPPGAPAAPYDPAAGDPGARRRRDRRPGPALCPQRRPGTAGRRGAGAGQGGAGTAGRGRAAGAGQPGAGRRPRPARPARPAAPRRRGWAGGVGAGAVPAAGGAGPGVDRGRDGARPPGAGGAPDRGGREPGRCGTGGWPR